LGSAILHLHQVGPGLTPGAVKHARHTQKTADDFAIISGFVFTLVNSISSQRLPQTVQRPRHPYA
jgi:hypothetical protein